MREESGKVGHDSGASGTNRDKTDGRTDGRTDGSSFEGDGCVTRLTDVKSDRLAVAVSGISGVALWSQAMAFIISDGQAGRLPRRQALRRLSLSTPSLQ